MGFDRSRSIRPANPSVTSIVAALLSLSILASACAASAPTTAGPIVPTATAVPATAAPTDPARATPAPATLVPAATTTPAPTTTAAPTAAATPNLAPTPTPAPRAQPAECKLVESRAGPRGEVEVDTEVVVTGLEVPWGLAILPSGDMLVTERPGRLRLIRDGQLQDDPILEIGISDPDPLFGIDRLGFEGGLLDVLLHPDFESNRLFYLFVNVANAEGQDIGRLLRYELGDDARSATLDRVILDDISTGLHHQGGRMRIGPDGMLFVTVGAYEPSEAQNPDTLAGKLLRLDLDGLIPQDNPDPASYVYVSGIRNSQGFDWLDDDHIVMVDHGPSGLELDRPDLTGFDEVNVVTAGDNLGWPRVWGCDEEPGLSPPVLTWTQSVPPTGAVFYRGDAVPEWTNSLLFTVVGRTTAQHLHRVELDPTNPSRVIEHETYLAGQYGRLRTIVDGADGRLYIMTSNCDARGVCPPSGDLILRLG